MLPHQYDEILIKFTEPYHAIYTIFVIHILAVSSQIYRSPSIPNVFPPLDAMFEVLMQIAEWK